MASKLKALLCRIRLLYRLYADQRVSSFYKVAIPLLFIAYLLWPVDLIPDALVGLGQTDDITVLVLCAKLFVELAPQEVVSEFVDNGTSGVIR